MCESVGSTPSEAGVAYPVAGANWRMAPPPLVDPPLVSTSTLPAASVSTTVGDVPSVASLNVYRIVAVVGSAAGTSNRVPSPEAISVEPLPVADVLWVMPNRLPDASIARSVGLTPAVPSKV